MDTAQTPGGGPTTPPTGGGTMHEPDGLASQFQRLRPYLISVGYGMLGSVSEAEDAVQESWLRLCRTDPSAIQDLRAWLTTVVGRICLDMLKARRARREDQDGTWLPEPLVAEPAADGPESQAIIAESIGLALLIVLESLTPPERLAFVLHDVFAVPFANIGQIMGRTPETARQLASRARRRVQAAPQPDPGWPAQRRAVDAFLAAARGGDFEGLLELLAPDVVLRLDSGTGALAPFELTGPQAVARHILRTAPRFLPHAIPAIVNGAPGALYGTWDEPLCVLGLTVAHGKIAEINLIADRAKLRHLRLSFAPALPGDDQP
jgi:RNA polymerase sigma-70 factor (ECF subfamily)